MGARAAPSFHAPRYKRYCSQLVDSSLLPLTQMIQLIQDSTPICSWSGTLVACN